MQSLTKMKSESAFISASVLTLLLPISVYLILVAVEIKGHGRLMNPPARNAMWRFGYAVPTNYDDNQLWCGGAQKYYENGEKCGVCGDDFAEPSPRDHETGGQFANGIVVRRYAPGQIIETEIQITANHLGYFEFKLCPVKDETKEVTEDCLNENTLKVLNGETWDTKYYVTSDEMAKDFIVKVKLPHHLTCNRCVMQWTYIADVGIIMNSGSWPPGKQPIFVTPPQNAILEPEKEGDNGKRKYLVVKSQVCVATKENPGIDDWCQKNCLRYPQNCPEDKCKCLQGCHAIGSFKENDGADSYCQYNCLVNPPKNCTAERCLCF
ncbi:hypothetical protein Fcan01_02764 [Folsomia candida]|uniref:Chitin-binding type-4 domain-containing protein n=1 Tax=Folsomia candida TaxID=158441 RepID=A0A226F3Q1_FOLCA|nr:hypothetical protein Fcan01_02764 [Folsomia candida]